MNYTAAARLASLAYDLGIQAHPANNLGSVTAWTPEDTHHVELTVLEPVTLAAPGMVMVAASEAQGWWKWERPVSAGSEVWTAEAVAECNEWLDDLSREEDALLGEYDRIAQRLGRIADVVTPSVA